LLAALSILPVVRVAMKMHYGKDLYLIFALSENDPEGECLRQAASYSGVDNRIHPWLQRNSRSRLLYARDKALAQVWLL
jgi:hypothetical protein